MPNALPILLIEDDEIDVMAFKRACRKAYAPEPIYVAADGIFALEWLRTTYLKAPTRLLIVLDLNMPRMGGHDFLTELRSDPALASLPVFVLTTSADARDVERAFSRQVAGYFVKGATEGGLPKLVELLLGFSCTSLLPNGVR